MLLLGYWELGLTVRERLAAARQERSPGTRAGPAGLGRRGAGGCGPSLRSGGSAPRTRWVRAAAAVGQVHRHGGLPMPSPTADTLALPRRMWSRPGCGPTGRTGPAAGPGSGKPSESGCQTRVDRRRDAPPTPGPVSEPGQGGRLSRRASSSRTWGVTPRRRGSARCQGGRRLGPSRCAAGRGATGRPAGCSSWHLWVPGLPSPSSHWLPCGYYKKN
jgi:hypothetical protein